MPTDTPDQQITLPTDPDVADNPQAFLNFVADVEQRLVRLYTNEADRTARRLSVAENEISALADVDRVEVWNGSLDISLYRRALYAHVVKPANQTLTSNSTVMQDVTSMVVALPATGVFSFRGVVYYDSTTVADVKLAFTIPAGSTLRWSGLGVVTGGTTSGDGVFNTVTVSDSLLAFGGAGAGTVMACHIEGEITTTGTAGNLQLRAAQNTAEVSNTLIIARSRLEVWRHG